MKIQNRKNVLYRTKFSADSIFAGCSNLMEELEAKEIAAIEEEKYFEAFLIQFSFIERKLEDITQSFADKLRISPSSLKTLSEENSVNRKISYFEFILSGFISKESSVIFRNLIEKLREYNSFRNDLLHHCSNSKVFKNAIHIDQSTMEAYDGGNEIIKLLLKLKIRQLNPSLNSDKTASGS
jgi:hypothetical protein